MADEAKEPEQAQEELLDAAPIVETPPPPKRPKSWLSYVFTYVRMLEYDLDRQNHEIDKLKAERDAMFDRMVRITTGFGMEEKMPDALEVEKRTRDMQPRTMHDFRSRMTADSLDRYEIAIRAKAEAEEKARRDKEKGDKSGDDTPTDAERG